MLGILIKKDAEVLAALIFQSSTEATEFQNAHPQKFRFYTWQTWGNENQLTLGYTPVDSIAYVLLDESIPVNDGVIYLEDDEPEEIEDEPNEEEMEDLFLGKSVDDFDKIK